MTEITHSEIDEVLKKESHQGDIFAKVRVEEKVDWVELDDE